MFLSNREKEILDLLIKSKGHYITIYEIAQQQGVSSRTIHRELKTLEQDINKYNLTIERVPKKGVQLNGSADDIHDLKNALAQNPTLDLTVPEQKAIILYALIQSKEPIKQYSLAHEIGVAATTLTKLLDELEENAKDYQLEIVRKRGIGVTLNGSEAKKREMLSHLMVDNLNSTSVYSVIENHFVYQSLNASQLSMVALENIFQVERVLMDDLSQLSYTLTEASYLTLTVHIVLSIERIQHGENVEIDDDIYQSVKDTKEYQIATELTEKLSKIYHVHFNKAEITFITIHLRGSKRKSDLEQTELELNNASKIQDLIHEVQARSNYKFDDLKTLEDGLRLHLIPAINRLNANIETHNPLTAMIQTKYPRLYDSVIQGLKHVWPNLSFPDSEAAFVVLHFGGALKNSKVPDLNILVVCSSGIGTSRVLATRLTQTFPDITQTKQASLSDLKHLNLNVYDGIISTLALDIDEPYIQVNPLLPDQDIKYVAHFLNSKQSDGNHQVQQSKVPLDKRQNLSNDAIISNITDNLAVLQNIHVEDANVSNWQDYVLKQLVKSKSIKHKSEFKNVLKTYAKQREIVLSPYRIGLPHMKHALIDKPMILFTRLKQPLKITEQQDTFEVDYLISMFLPAESPSSAIVSAISEVITCNLHRIDELMNNPNEMIDEMKQTFINETKQILNME